ncbi:DNA mismatch repair protein MutL [Owenweeksia hongkongensis DSM 17368]|uniref:DNA mismatch repair protein MutL n=1 Tax=Owenweeksia hongkongensis (strain DSM 17368 / CIP 108786 / JCM 12287 / NRRL B-23963 / UST20020801) TaxID=926562 RepID=G8R597_OWEHD|nr:DNA mismatch repair endonuclease MutL [Owenweeksia hongkongensis]AEV32142.1 DNA mismatch repair protein MutL [Owenweeksia hongkongensis DSM 17368]
MSDVIRLLPDSVANQIAAGEVVQRPASAVKELLENSIDAGADHITLIIKDAGKTLMQVIDNGTGMSETDARMAFERHATSKIQKAEDIFAIHTKGFRGEALASIAAVAQVELKTKKEDEELGVMLRVEGSKVMEQEYCNTKRGTQLEVKNLFFNIPARRNFLKSNNVELRHIIDEFERVALAHPDIHFSFVNNGNELFDLPAAGLRQRIVNIFGSKFNEKLVPVDEETPILKLTGFICKPEFSKKTRGEQFFFANNRYIRNNYLHRAVCNAFEGLLTEGSHPSYFLFMDIDPAKIDVNIHPTKTEIKFEDERSIFTIIRTAVKHALGQYNIAPSLDFESDVDFVPQMKKGQTVPPPGVHINPNFNPFDEQLAGRSSSSATRQTSFIPQDVHTGKSQKTQDWEKLFEDIPELPDEPKRQETLEMGETTEVKKSYSQIGRKYIFTNHGTGIIMIHQQRAHERILFERIFQSLENKNIPSQQLLFPQNISFSASDYQLIISLLPSLREVGFDIDEFGQNEVIINGIPLYLDSNLVKDVLERLLEDEKDHKSDGASKTHELMATTLAKVSAIKTGSPLNTQEMHKLVDELFACEMPYVSLAGKPVVVNLNLEDIDKSFN